MSYGTCNECTFCRINGIQMDDYLKDRYNQLKKYQKDLLPCDLQGEFNEQRCLCMRHSPKCIGAKIPDEIQHNTGGSDSDVTNEIFPTLSNFDAWYGNCGCGEFEKHKRTKKEAI